MMPHRHPAESEWPCTEHGWPKSTPPGLWNHEHYPYVHHIGLCRTSDEQIAEALKEGIGIMANEGLLRVEAHTFAPCAGRPVGHGAGGISGAIRAVGASA